mmetsp:Transcript_1482/g.4479  ORF Transcript_1482/g.4479 Transcript_1482/m.4479 type:complete len:247 (-) Transcript_1482:363-1103(-)
MPALPPMPAAGSPAPPPPIPPGLGPEACASPPPERKKPRFPCCDGDGLQVLLPSSSSSSPSRSPSFISSYCHMLTSRSEPEDAEDLGECAACAALGVAAAVEAAVAPPRLRLRLPQMSATAVLPTPPPLPEHVVPCSHSHLGLTPAAPVERLMALWGLAHSPWVLDLDGAVPALPLPTPSMPWSHSAMMRCSSHSWTRKLFKISTRWSRTTDSSVNGIAAVIRPRALWFDCNLSRSVRAIVAICAS